MPEDAEFQPRFPWLGADLQTLRNFLRRPRHDLSPWPQKRLRLDLADGSGDRLAAALHLPAPDTPPRLPVVLLHGLAGCEDSTYMRASTRHLLRAGHAVLRLNLRGAGPSRPLCRQQYHAGRSEDLRAALRALQTVQNLDLSRGLFLCGYSLGGNVLLKFLGELSRHAQPDLPVVRAAAAVSAPIDLKACQVRMMQVRNTLYQRYLLRRMRAECLAAPSPLTAEERTTIRSVRTLLEFDEKIVAPRNGFACADDYYASCSARSLLPRIAIPTLVVQALDDPWIPRETFTRMNWQANPSLYPMLCTVGGHVGFHARGSSVAWYDRRMLAFFERMQ